MGGIFGFFLGVSMVSVVHSVQKFYDRVMTRLGINMLLIFVSQLNELLFHSSFQSLNMAE